MVALDRLTLNALAPPEEEELLPLEELPLPDELLDELLLLPDPLPLEELLPEELLLEELLEELEELLLDEELLEPPEELPPSPPPPPPPPPHAVRAARVIASRILFNAVILFIAMTLKF